MRRLQLFDGRDTGCEEMFLPRGREARTHYNANYDLTAVSYRIPGANGREV